MLIRYQPGISTVDVVAKGGHIRRVRVAVLGPLEVDEGRILLAPRDEVVLEALAARPGETVRTEALAEALWGEHRPASWPKVVQGCIHRLRKVLGTASIETAGHGYRLVLHRDAFDHLRFEDLLLRATELLETGEAERARYASGQALMLWRGEPLERLTEWDRGRVESERLRERRLDAEDLHAESAIRSGRHRQVLGELNRMVAEQPTRERRWGLLATAQYRDGRQAEALGTLQRARGTLVNEYGLDPGPELAELEQAILRQDPSLVVTSTPPAEEAACPYLGLVAYDLTDSAAYFGREMDVAACLDRLDATGVLAVVGPSGSGKSSLVRAGIAAALVRDGSTVRIVTPGHHPEDVLSRAPEGDRAVLVVDQCEEALALPETSPDREEFFDGLVDFAVRGRLIISLRADRLGELAAHPPFAHLVENGLYLLGAMGPDQLRRAIEGPAAQAGLRLEPGLADLLVRETEGSASALPLLSHVLRQTWRHREMNTLTVAGYTATGGVREAVALSAERLYREMTPAQQGMLRDLMVRLVSSNDTGEPVRTRVLRRTVAPDDEHTAVVEQMVGARLLSSDGDTVEIAHESLAVAWPRLRSWLDDDVEGLRIMRHLAVATESWNELGRPDSELYRGVRQARAVEWRDRAQPSLTAAEEDFLAASTELAEREQRATLAQVRRERRLNRRLRVGLAAVVVLLGVAVVAGGMALNAAGRAARQARSADARRLGAEALRSEAFDRSLLLAAAGVVLDDSVDTRNYLLATLGRAPSLVSSARSPRQVVSMDVNFATGQVAVVRTGGSGVALYDGRDLHEVPLPADLPGAGVLASPDGQRYALSVVGSLVKDRVEPPVLLLDATGARSSVQLGGFPRGYFVFENIGFGPITRDNMAFSADSRYLAVAMRDLQDQGPNLTVVWDLRSPRRPVAVVKVGEVRDPIVSPDGRTLFTVGTGERHLQVTELPSGRTRRVVAAKDLGVRGLDDILVQSPDARTLAVGAGVEAVLLDVATMRPRAHLSGQGPTTGLAFSADGTRVAASGDRLIVWDISGRDPVRLLAQDGQMDHPHFSRDGRTLYTRTYAGLVQAWDLAGDRRFLAAHPGDTLTWVDAGSRLSPDGKKIGYVALTPKFRVRDVATGKLGPVVSPPMGQGRYLDIAWHPDSTILNITSGDAVVRTFDSTTGREIAQHRLAPPPSTEGAAMALFSVDGRYLLVGTTEGRLHVLDAYTLAPARAPIQVYEKRPDEPSPKEVENLAPSGDLHTVWMSDRIVDYVTGTVRSMPQLGFPVNGVVPSPDGRRLFVDTGTTGVGLLDVASMHWILNPIAAQAGLMGGNSQFSDDGTLFASVNENRLSYWDGRTGNYLGTITVDYEGQPAFSKDERRLLFAGSTGSLLTWDLDHRSWIAAACRLAGRPLTQQEWRNYLPNRPFERVCAT